MTEATNGLNYPELGAPTSSMKLAPREFIFKYLKYLPWVIICVIAGLVIAYLKIRYSIPIYHVESSMLIKNDKGKNMGDDKFDELFFNQQNVNLSNETQILKSRIVLRRVAQNLDFQIRYQNKGKIRSTLCYPDAPVSLQILHVADSTVGFGLNITVLDDDQFMLGNKPGKKMVFGEVFEIGGNRCILFRNHYLSIRKYASPEFQISWNPIEAVVAELAGNLKIVQPTDQSTILTLSFESPNIAFGEDILNMLMMVYDSLNVEDKNQISLNTLNFINTSLDTVTAKLNVQENGVKDFMSRNNIFNVDNESLKYLDQVQDNTKNLTDLQVRIGIVDLLLKYIGDDKNEYNRVPTNLGIEDPLLIHQAGHHAGALHFHRLIKEQDHHNGEHHTKHQVAEPG